MHKPILPLGDSHFLSSLAATDVAAMVTGLNDPAVIEHTLRIPYPYTMEDAKAFLMRAEDGQQSGRELHFAIRDDSGQLIGGCGFHDVHTGHRAEIGYWLARAKWGNGIMTAAVRTVCEFGFEQLKLVRIVAHVFESNRASARVLEKCGFQREGLLRKHVRKQDRFIDVLVYGNVKLD